MKKYKLLKELPWCKVWTIYDEYWNYEDWKTSDLFKAWIIDNEDIATILWVWIEEIKEEENPMFRIWDKVVVDMADFSEYCIITNKTKDWYRVWYTWPINEKLTRLATPEEIQKYFI